MKKHIFSKKSPVSHHTPPSQQSTGPNYGQPAQPHLSENHKPMHRERVKNGLSTIAILLLAPIVAILLTAFVFQSYQVDGPSMDSTLHNNDRLIVLKTARTWSRITNHSFVPNRGDIIIFNKSDLGQFSGQSGTKQLIKRVIGLPGDRVVVKDSTLTIYNATYPDGFSPDKTYSYGSVITSTTGNIDVSVAKDEVFVCGDNRPNSLDSRVFGAIPVKDIVGKLGLRILPLHDARKF